MITIMYGHKKNEPAYKEVIIKEWEEKPLREEVKKVQQWAEARGYVTRLHRIDLSTPPDFVKTVNI